MRTGLFMIVPSISLPCFSRARVVLVMGGVCLKCKLQLTDSIGGMTMYTSRRSDQNRKFVRFEAIVLIPIQVRSHLHSPFRHLGHRYRYCVGDSAMITYRGMHRHIRLAPSSLSDSRDRERRSWTGLRNKCRLGPSTRDDSDESEDG